MRGSPRSDEERELRFRLMPSYYAAESLWGGQNVARLEDLEERAKNQSQQSNGGPESAEIRKR